MIVSCNYSVRASHWEVLPSQGTDGHSVHLLKTLFAHCGGLGEGYGGGSSYSSTKVPSLTF